MAKKYNTLYAGYWTGEFGWQLMAWQAKIRHIAKSYDNIIVGCQEQNDHLYQDFATEFIRPEKGHGRIYSNRNMWTSNKKVYNTEGANKNDVHIPPSKEFCLGDNYKSDFIKYGNYNIGLEYDILIHARITQNLKTGYRNYDCAKWGRIVDFFSDKRVACIGSGWGAARIEGVDNLIGIDLSKLCDVMASSKVLLSPSSGPAHLASLCGLPHIVWSDTKRWGIGKYTNKDRYEKIWNPLNTKCTFIPSEDWKPDYRKVIFECQKTLSQY